MSLVPRAFFNVGGIPHFVKKKKKTLSDEADTDLLNYKSRAATKTPREEERCQGTHITACGLMILQHVNSTLADCS